MPNLIACFALPPDPACLVLMNIPPGVEDSRTKVLASESRSIA